jgi:putative transposase
MKYLFIQVHHGQFVVQEMCHEPHVSSSGYYRWRSGRLSRRAQQDAQLAEQIRAIYEVSQGRYGSPRVHQELQAQGMRCSEKRVAPLMQEHHLVARVPRKFVVTTDSQHALPVASNELDREYQVEQWRR